MNVYRYHGIWGLIQLVTYCLLHVESSNKAYCISKPNDKSNKWSPSATTYKCNIQDCGDLLDIFGGLQIYELKLAKDDHELTKVYFYLNHFILGEYELIELDNYAYVACYKMFEWIN